MFHFGRLNRRHDEEQVEHITLKNTRGRLNGRHDEEYITLQNTRGRLNGRHDEEQVEHHTAKYKGETESWT